MIIFLLFSSCNVLCVNACSNKRGDLFTCDLHSAIMYVSFYLKLNSTVGCIAVVTPEKICWIMSCFRSCAFTFKVDIYINMFVISE
jgi:hypothetical protein